MAAVSGGLETMERRVLCIQCSPGSLDSEFVNYACALVQLRNVQTLQNISMVRGQALESISPHFNFGICIIHWQKFEKLLQKQAGYLPRYWSPHYHSSWTFASLLINFTINFEVWRSTRTCLVHETHLVWIIKCTYIQLQISTSITQSPS